MWDLGLGGRILSVRVFLRDPSPYLREFRRKPRKIPNGQVDKRDRGMNLAPPVYQFLSTATGGAKGRTARHPCLTRDSNPGPLVQQPASLTASPPVGFLISNNKLLPMLIFFLNCSFFLNLFLKIILKMCKFCTVKYLN